LRIVFVDNLLFEDAEGIRRYVLQPHLGLISLIAVLEAAGHEGVLFDPKVEVARGRLRLDADLYRDASRAILALRPDVVGFTSLGCNFICTAKTAGHLKCAEPDLPILLGGPHASVLDRSILQAFPQFDVIVRNEAEDIILPVIDALPQRAFARLPGISFVSNGSVQSNPGEPLIADLDRLPIPAYHHYPVRELGLTSLRIDAGRGCPFQCTFCSTASFFGRRYRLKSSVRLRDELDLMHHNYGISDFALTHDLFTVNRRKVIEFCDAVAGRGYTWKCSARQDCVDDELLERMRAAGCRSIYYGIEAGSPRMQEISKKRLDLALFDPILDATQKRGMSATVSFITGYPEEERTDQNATLDLIGHSFGKDAAPLNVQLHLLTPEPGTALLSEHGANIAYDGHISDFNFPTLEDDDGAVIAANPSVFINHHYFPSVLPRDRHIFVTTSYQHLYGLGFPLLRYILRQFDGRFSGLIDAMERWRMRNGLPATCFEPMVAAYFADTFGVGHHVTGLVRYMLSAAALRRRAINGETVPGGRHDGYRLSRRTALLRRVPDCERILRALIVDEEGAIDKALLRRRYDFLIYLAQPGNDTIENLRLNEVTATFFERLAHGRPAGPEDAGKHRAECPAPPASFMRTLTGWGILESGSDGEAKRAGAA